jgi:hypothetical protein
MTEVEVALVGRNADLQLGPAEFVTDAWWDHFLEGENGREWEDRRRVVLTVADDETLREVFDRAVGALGAFEADWSTWTPDWSDPEHPPDPGRRTTRLMALRADDSPLPLLERMSREITIVDDRGLGIWDVSHYDVTFGQLERSASAGALYGDPTQIYLFIRFEPAGGGVAHSWELLLQAWEVAEAVARGVGAVAVGYKVARAVHRRLAGRVVVAEKAREWVGRNGGADFVARTLRGEPWRPRDFAGIHGCTTQEAEQVLALFGYSPGVASEEWIFTAGNPALGLAANDAAAELVVRYTREVQWRDAAAAPSVEMEELFKAMLERASTVGDLSEFGHLDQKLQPGAWGEGRNWFG